MFSHPVARELENPSEFSLMSQGSEEGGAEGDAVKARLELEGALDHPPSAVSYTFTPSFLVPLLVRAASPILLF